MKRFMGLACLFTLFFLVHGIPVTLAGAEETGNDSKAGYEMLYWESVKDSENIDMYKAYIQKYPKGIFVDLAEIKIKVLENKTAKPTKSTPEPVKDTGDSLRPANFQLRTMPERLEEQELIKILRKYNFCDLKRNADGDFANALQDNNDGTITDAATGLIWEKVGSWRKKSRKSADDYIEDLNRNKFAGKTNWRLPTIEELASLIESKYSERDWLYIDPVFGDPGGDWLDSCWSADSLRPMWGADNAAWVVSFKHGSAMVALWASPGFSVGSNVVKYESNYVRAVCSDR